MLMPRPGRRAAADHHRAPANGGAAPVAGVSGDPDRTRRHGLPQAPSRTAPDLHFGTVHEAAAIVADAAFEGDGDGRQDPHRQVVLGLGPANPNAALT